MLKTYLLLFIIFLVALFFRFYNLETTPHGFHIDEAIIADNANFILHTGRDTNNNFLPLQTEVFKDYNPTGYVYLAILPIKFLGLNIFAARLPGALLGSLTVFALFLLIYSLFEKKSLALLGSLLFALSPWDIVLSRSTEEAGAAIFFTTLGFALFIFSLRKKNTMSLIGGFISLFFSFFMYFTPRFFTPLLLLTFFFSFKYWWDRRKEKFTWIFITAFTLLSIISIILVLGTKGGANRFNQISIFGFPETKLVQEEQIREDGTLHVPYLATKIFHNKIDSYGYTFINNYLDYFSPGFLFTKGGLPNWLQIPQMGVVYIIELPFILYGIYRLLIEKKKWTFILLTWILIAPAAAALTVDDVPNVRRALIMAPILETFAAYGIFHFFNLIPGKKRNLAAGVLVILFLFNIAYFCHNYFIHANVHQNWYRSEAYDQMMQKIKNAYNQYDHIILSIYTGGNYAEVLFYMDYDPSTYLKEGATKDKTYTGFGKFFFVPGLCPASSHDDKIPTGKNITVETGSCKNVSGKKKVKQEYIDHSDGSHAFHIVYD